MVQSLENDDKAELTRQDKHTFVHYYIQRNILVYHPVDWDRTMSVIRRYDICFVLVNQVYIINSLPQVTCNICKKRKKEKKVQCLKVGD